MDSNISVKIFKLFFLTSILLSLIISIKYENNLRYTSSQYKFISFPFKKSLNTVKDVAINIVFFDIHK